jgi:hypothetical protein
MIIQNIRLSIPDIKNMTMIHGISKDFLLSSPTSRYYKKTYNSIKKLKSLNKKVGEIAALQNNDRYIVYMFIKEYDWESEDELIIIKCLKELNKFCKVNNVTEIVFIRNDYKNWNNVIIELLKLYLHNVSYVTICDHISNI